MGGNAFLNTRRILQSEIPGTLLWLSGQLNYPYCAMSNSLLGSGGKWPDSGDLDINVDIENSQLCKLLDVENLCRVLGPDHVKAKMAIGQVYTSVPISGNSLNGRVQVDFMFGNYEWQKFSYHSAGPNASKFKGLFRTELLKAITAFNSDWVLFDDNGDMLARVGPTFFPETGLVWRCRSRIYSEKLKKYTLTFKILSLEDFLKLHSTAKLPGNTTISDPVVAADFLLGSTIDKCDSFESIMAELPKKYSKKDIASILKIYRERLYNMNVVIPQEIENVIAV